MKNETPAPPPPIAGSPKSPYMKTAFRGALRASIASDTHIVTCGRDTAAFTAMKVRAAIEPGRASAVQNMYSVAMRRTSPSAPPNSIQKSVAISTGTPISENPSTSHMAWPMSTPMSENFRAP